MDEKKTWFRPDFEYQLKTTEWRTQSPELSGWYDTIALRLNKEDDIEYVNLPYVERRWFDVKTGMWSLSCMVGDPESFAEAIKKVGYKHWYSIRWRGLVEKPVYPPGYFDESVE